MTKIDEETRQREFERGQRYEKEFKPLDRPVQGPFEDDEHYQDRDKAFEDGRRSIQNDPNQ